MQETEEFEVPTGETTVGGSELFIVPTRSGMYKIEARGVGAPPKEITDQLFTNIPFAKRALEQYSLKYGPQIRKKANMQAAIERRQEAAKLKNGELDTTVNGPKNVKS